jgi:hypothetical protein
MAHRVGGVVGGDVRGGGVGSSGDGIKGAAQCCRHKAEEETEKSYLLVIFSH